MICLVFPGFSGTPEELREALRRGRLRPEEVPVLEVIQMALDQVPEDLRARSELLPILAELLLLKLAPRRALGEEEPTGEVPLVQALVDLSETVAFLEARLRARARVLPVPAPPLPPRALRLSPERLLKAARAYRPLSLAFPERGLELWEVWARLRPGLARGVRRAFADLPLREWREKALGFFLLLEASRLGRVRLYQEAPFAPLWVEVLAEEEVLGDLHPGAGVQPQAHPHEAWSGEA